jgi:hypothetical protein
VRRHRNRPHARPAAAVRDAKGLVQVQVADVRPHVARTAPAHLGIQVGAIHVNLAAPGVHNGANLPNAFFKHAVR